MSDKRSGGGMSRRTRWLGAGLVAVVVLAAGGYYVFARQSTGGPAPVSLGSDPISLGSGTSGASSNTTADASGTWTLAGSQSFVGYRVREKLGFLPAPSDAVGRTTAVTGTMTVAGKSVTSVKISADLTQLKSNEARRDQHLQTMGLETNTFPTATFSLTSPITFAQKPAQGAVVKESATGDFTLHGVTKQITIPIQARWDGSTIEIVSSFPVQFSDYSIQAPSIGGFVSVQDNGTVELKLVFTK
jgi:polyisoprenoid-binding protein YceI